MNSQGVIEKFKEMLNNSYTMINISESSNPCLYPYYEHIRTQIADIWVGIVFADSQGIYTPIEDNRDGVFHLVRLPRINIPVYALTDMRSVVYAKCNNLTIVFQGVYRTPHSGYAFISNEFYIRPVPGVSFDKKLLIPHAYRLDKDVVIYDDEDEDDDDNDW